MSNEKRDLFESSSGRPGHRCTFCRRRSFVATVFMHPDITLPDGTDGVRVRLCEEHLKQSRRSGGLTALVRSAIEAGCRFEPIEVPAVLENYVP